MMSRLESIKFFEVEENHLIDNLIDTNNESFMIKWTKHEITCLVEAYNSVGPRFGYILENNKSSIEKTPEILCFKIQQIKSYLSWSDEKLMHMVGVITIVGDNQIALIKDCFQ